MAETNWKNSLSGEESRGRLLFCPLARGKISGDALE